MVLQHEISRAADDGLRGFLEHNDGDVTEADKIRAMKAAVKSETRKLRSKMTKFLAVANPELTPAWLREVSIRCLSLNTIISLILNIHLSLKKTRIQSLGMSKVHINVDS